MEVEGVLRSGFAVLPSPKGYAALRLPSLLE